jgi:predicted HD phosphohydrolase
MQGEGLVALAQGAHQQVTNAEGANQSATVAKGNGLQQRVITSAVPTRLGEKGDQG